MLVEVGVQLDVAILEIVNVDFDTALQFRVAMLAHIELVNSSNTTRPVTPRTWVG